MLSVHRQLQTNNFLTAFSDLNNCCDNIITFNDLSNDDEAEEEEVDIFYTPPSSPDIFEMEIDDHDCFNDTLLPEFDIFLTGCVNNYKNNTIVSNSLTCFRTSPTKQDAEVYNAVKLAGDQLTAEKYPNVYKWFHTVSLNSEAERQM